MTGFLAAKSHPDVVPKKGVRRPDSSVNLPAICQSYPYYFIIIIHISPRFVKDNLYFAPNRVKIRPFPLFPDGVRDALFFASFLLPQSQKVNDKDREIGKCRHDVENRKGISNPKKNVEKHRALDPA